MIVGSLSRVNKSRDMSRLYRLFDDRQIGEKGSIFVESNHRSHLHNYVHSPMVQMAINSAVSVGMQENI